MPVNELYDEKALLLSITNNDEQAFRTLYNHYFPKMYAFAINYASNTALAQDVTQEAFARVWQHRLKLKHLDSFEAWLVTITRNLLINELRKAYPRGWQPVADINTETQDHLQYRELETLVKGAIAALSTRQKQVYHLSRVEGYTHKQIADSLGISVDMSREHMSKALQHIRHHLKNKYGHAGLLVALLHFF